MYFGKVPSQPWIDAADLIEIVKTEGFTIRNGEIVSTNGSKSTYRWRDTNIRIVLDNKTNEITDIYEL